MTGNKPCLFWRSRTLHPLIGRLSLDQFKFVKAEETDWGQDVIQFIKIYGIWLEKLFLIYLVPISAPDMVRDVIFILLNMAHRSTFSKKRRKKKAVLE
jgi:hypothetical protein